MTEKPEYKKLDHRRKFYHYCRDGDWCCGHMGRVQRDHGDADVPFDSRTPEANIFTNLTANRTITLPTTDVYRGMTFTITRGGNGTGTMAVGSIRTLSPNQWIRIGYTGSLWKVISYGNLT